MLGPLDQQFLKHRMQKFPASGVSEDFARNLLHLPVNGMKSVSLHYSLSGSIHGAGAKKPASQIRPTCGRARVLFGKLAKHRDSGGPLAAEDVVDGERLPCFSRMRS